MKSAGSRVLVFIAVLGFSLTCRGVSLADTVHLKNASSIKGIVIEDYVDRIVYSTIDGEREILKSDIVRIEYDEAFDNLVKMGDSSFEKGYYRAALKYYLMAQEVNPDISSLNNKIYHTEAIIYKTPEKQKRDLLAMKNEVISGRPTTRPEMEKVDPQEAIKAELRISIERGNSGRFYVGKISKDSPFKKAGAKPGDAVISVWSKLCDYLSFDDLYDLLTDEREAMTNVVIERQMSVKGRDPSGAGILMEWEGAVIGSVKDDSPADNAGLKEGDLITKIKGKSIRYTPLKAVTGWFEERKEDLGITVQRKLVIFKSD